MAFMHQQHALREAQKVVTDWLVPNGITAEQVLERLLPILDNRMLVHEQRMFDEPYKDWLKHRNERNGN